MNKSSLTLIGICMLYGTPHMHTGTIESSLIVSEGGTASFAFARPSDNDRLVPFLPKHAINELKDPTIRHTLQAMHDRYLYDAWRYAQAIRAVDPAHNLAARGRAYAALCYKRACNDTGGYYCKKDKYDGPRIDFHEKTTEWSIIIANIDQTRIPRALAFESRVPVNMHNVYMPIYAVNADKTINPELTRRIHTTMLDDIHNLKDTDPEIYNGIIKLLVIYGHKSEHFEWLITRFMPQTDKNTCYSLYCQDPEMSAWLIQHLSRPEYKDDAEPAASPMKTRKHWIDIEKITTIDATPIEPIQTKDRTHSCTSSLLPKKNRLVARTAEYRTSLSATHAGLLDELFECYGILFLGNKISHPEYEKGIQKINDLHTFVSRIASDSLFTHGKNDYIKDFIITEAVDHTYTTLKQVLDIKNIALPETYAIPQKTLVSKWRKLNLRSAIHASIDEEKEEITKSIQAIEHDPNLSENTELQKELKRYTLKMEKILRLEEYLNYSEQSGHKAKED